MAEPRPPEMPIAAMRAMLRWFKATKVSGVFIGGVAVSIQAHARYTRDFDALVVVQHAKWPTFVGRAAEFGFADSAHCADWLLSASLTRPRRLAAMLRRLKPDLVHIATEGPLGPAPASARRHGTPVAGRTTRTGPGSGS